MEPGTRVGRYVVEARLAEGGMGAVWRARADGGGRVAIKTVRASAAAPSAVDVRALEAEIAALRALDHPRIVRILDDGVRDGRPWFAMDWIEGADLRAWARVEPRPSVARIVGVFHPLLLALGALHAQGLVHGDVKLANVLVRADGPVIVDLGLATVRRLEREVLGPDEDVILGSAHTIAPERIRGEPLDGRADLYAVGCMLYELLSGRPPFEGTDPVAIVRAHLAEAPPPLASRVPELPSALAALVHRLLARDPADRPPFAGEVARALAQSVGLAHDPAQEPPIRLFRPRLRGRTAALDRVAGAIAERPVVAVSGASGAGKTRLLRELARERADGRMVIAVACRNDLRHTALGPLRPILRERLGEAFGRLDADEARIARLCGLDVADPDPPGTLPEAARQRTLDAVVRALARPPETWLILDDVQLADDVTFALIRAVARSEAAGLRVIVGLRDADPEIRASLGDGEVVALGPLPADAVGEIARDMLAGPAPAALLDAVVARADGQPLLVGEILRAAIERGVLVRHQGGWVLAGDPTALSSAAELLAGRIAGLSATARRVAGALAVLGDADAAQVVAVADLDERKVASALAELRRRELLAPVEDGLALAHGRIASAVQSSLSVASRRALHGRAADQPTVTGSARAYQLARAGRVVESGRAYLLAAIAARDQHALGAAEHLAREAQRHGDPATVAAARLLWVEVLRGEGRMADLEAAAAWVLDAPGPAELPDQLTLRAALVQSARECGRFELARARAEALVALARRAGDRAAEAMGQRELAVLDFLLQDFDQAEARLLAALDLLDLPSTAPTGQRGGPSGPAARHARERLRIVGDLGVFAVNDGREEEGLARLEEAVAWARRAGDARVLGHQLLNLGKALQETPRHAEARGRFEEALELLRAVGDRKHEGTTLHALGELALERGDRAEARRLLEAGQRLAEETGGLRQLAFGAIRLGHLHRMEGRLEEAEAAFDLAIRMQGETGQDRDQLGSLLFRGEVRALRGLPDPEAETCLDDYALDELPLQLLVLRERLRRRQGRGTSARALDDVLAGDLDPTWRAFALIERGHAAREAGEDPSVWIEAVRQVVGEPPPGSELADRLAELEG